MKYLFLHVVESIPGGQHHIHQHTQRTKGAGGPERDTFRVQVGTGPVLVYYITLENYELFQRASRW